MSVCPSLRLLSSNMADYPLSILFKPIMARIEHAFSTLNKKKIKFVA